MYVLGLVKNVQNSFPPGTISVLASFDSYYSALFIFIQAINGDIVCVCRVSANTSDQLTANHGYQPLLNWKFVNDKMAWGVLLLMGGGFAMADACTVRTLVLFMTK